MSQVYHLLYQNDRHYRHYLNCSTVPFWLIQHGLLCWKSVCVTSHWGQCWTHQMCDNAKMPKNYLKQMFFGCFAIFGSCSLLPHPITCKTPLQLPIWALLSVEILPLSQSQTTCVEVLNWSNMSQSQGCVKLIEMVQ